MSLGGSNNAILFNIQQSVPRQSLHHAPIACAREFGSNSLFSCVSTRSLQDLSARFFLADLPMDRERLPHP